MKNSLKIIKKYKIQIFCMAIIIVSIISVIIQYLDKNNEMKVNSQTVKNKDNKIAVYINGAIKNPGVYYLEQDARLYQLLDVCGGINENADINNINLAKKLVDSDMITIPEKRKINELDEEEIFDEERNDNKININTATKSELMSLNGIGEQTAQKIIDYRKENYFSDVEDLLNVNGIGQSKYESIKEYICVD